MRVEADCSSPPTWVGGKLVYCADDGAVFVMTQAVSGGKPRRRYGQVIQCGRCQKHFFDPTQQAALCAKCLSKPRKKLKPLTHKTTKVELDIIFGRIVRSRARCENCGARNDLECAHGFSRRYLRVRWDERNAFCLCHNCHHHFTEHPLQWDAWLRARWGEGLYGTMFKRALHGPRVDFDEQLDQLQKRERSLKVTGK